MALFLPSRRQHLTPASNPSSLQEPAPKAPAYAPEEDAPQGVALIDSKDADELEELEDDFADDRFLEEYRRRRLAELQQAPARPRFGSLEPIRGADFVAQVTNAGEGVWAVCHLHKDSVQDCAILNACFAELAERYPATKFVKIVSTDCIPGYPDENLPTVLLYRDSKCLQTLVGLAPFGGRATGPDRVALALNRHGDVCGDGEKDTAAQVRGMVKDMLDKGRNLGKGSDDEDSDFD